MPTSRRRREMSRSASTPYWVSDCGRAVVYVGDCRDVLQVLDAGQFHAVVTDPPYDLTSDVARRRSAFPGRYAGTEGERRGFMGQKWDGTGVAFDPETWDRVLRVTLPGAHLLSFGGSRTYHRMVCAVEDAGWEVRDCLMWLYATGFPKSTNISKAIDKMYGVEREYTPIDKLCANRVGDGTIYGLGHSGKTTSNEPVTDAAKQWDGWGTTLKPAYEPIILARKPFQGSIARNVLERGCGGLNIDSCRIGTEDIKTQAKDHSASPQSGLGMTGYSGCPENMHVGRWPANVVLTHHPECKLIGNRPSNDTTSNGGLHRGSGETVGSFTGAHHPIGINPRPDDEIWECHEDCPCRLLDEQSEMSSRYFFTSKANADDRPHQPVKKRRNRNEPEMVKLRDDLTPEQKEFVLSELARLKVAL